MGIESRVAELQLTLPPIPKPVATYRTAVRHGNLVYVSGHGPLKLDGTLHLGRLGANLDLEAGYAAARATALAILSTLRAHLGSLDKLVRPVKALGLVCCTPEFVDHPKVINGFSDLMVEIFGEEGKAARSAFGVPALPNGMAVEIECIFEVRD